MRFLYIGKFQPFHFGHLNAINIIREFTGDIVLAIGSPNEERYFSLDERINMVKGNTSINPRVVEDLDENHPLYNDWGKYVLEVVGDVDVVATGNRYVQRDFNQEGKHVLFFSRDKSTLSGTLIRNSIESGDKLWTSLVPEKTKAIIESSRYYGRFNNG